MLCGYCAATSMHDSIHPYMCPSRHTSDTSIHQHKQRNKQTKQTNTHAFMQIHACKLTRSTPPQRSEHTCSFQTQTLTMAGEPLLIQKSLRRLTLAMEVNANMGCIAKEIRTTRLAGEHVVTQDLLVLIARRQESDRLGMPLLKRLEAADFASLQIIWGKFSLTNVRCHTETLKWGLSCLKRDMLQSSFQPMLIFSKGA